MIIVLLPLRFCVIATKSFWLRIATIYLLKQSIEIEIEIEIEIDIEIIN